MCVCVWGGVWKQEISVVCYILLVECVQLNHKLYFNSSEAATAHHCIPLGSSNESLQTSLCNHVHTSMFYLRMTWGGQKDCIVKKSNMSSYDKCTQTLYVNQDSVHSSTSR